MSPFVTIARNVGGALGAGTFKLLCSARDVREMLVHAHRNWSSDIEACTQEFDLRATRYCIIGTL
eukprot:583333-Pelagomonas_calceolata.AAC.3